MTTQSAMYQALIDRIFPVKYQGCLPNAFRAAYRAVDQVLETVTFLKEPTGLQLRGDLIGAAVDYQMTALMKTGQIPEGFRFTPNRRRTADHLEVLFDECLVTISQVAVPAAFPRFAFFRDALRMTNQLCLPMPELGEAYDSSAKPHIVITHGYRRLDFIRIGLPDHKRREWLHQKPLMSAKADGSNHSLIVETPLIQDHAFVTLKRSVERELEQRLDEDVAG